MLACGRSLIVGVCWIGCLIGTARGNEPLVVGDLIYPKSNEVPIRVGDKLFGTASDITSSARIRQVDGELLCIWVEGKKTEG